MIRALQTEDISAVSAIWLNTNLSAHAFIPSQYWEGQLSEVTEALAKPRSIFVREREPYRASWASTAVT